MSVWGAREGGQRVQVKGGGGVQRVQGKGGQRVQSGAEGAGERGTRAGAVGRGIYTNGLKQVFP